jgi:hypothetical protein
MWSVGCIVAEMYLKEAIFPGNSRKKFNREIVLSHKNDLNRGTRLNHQKHHSIRNFKTFLLIYISFRLSPT